MFFLISQVAIKQKTNIIGLDKTLSYAKRHKLKVPLCRNKINFHLLLEGESFNKSLRDEVQVFRWFM